MRSSSYLKRSSCDAFYCITRESIKVHVMSVRCVWDISLSFGCISSKLEAAGVIIIIIINIIIILSHVSVMFLHQSAWPWSELWLGSIRSTVFVLSLTAWWMALVETSELQLQLLLARQGNVMQCFGSSVVQVKFRWSDVILFRGSQQVCNDSHLCWRCKCFRTFYRGWIKPFPSSSASPCFSDELESELCLDRSLIYTSSSVYSPRGISLSMKTGFSLLWRWSHSGLWCFLTKCFALCLIQISDSSHWPVTDSKHRPRGSSLCCWKCDCVCSLHQHQNVSSISHECVSVRHDWCQFTARECLCM